METVEFGNSSAAALVKDFAGEELWMTVAVGAVITFSMSFWMYGVLRRRQRSGPVIWPVVGTVIEMRRNFHRINDWYLDHFSDAVKTWRFKLPYPLSQSVIATVDPVNVEYILTNIHKYGKSETDKFKFRDFLGDGIFVVNGDAWRRHRKIASTEFSTRKVREHSNGVFREDAIKLANVLKQAVAAGKPVEFQSLAQRMTLDSISKVAFGVELGALSADLPRVPFAEALDAAQCLILKRTVDPLFKMRRALNIGRERRLRTALDEVNLFAKNVIIKRREEIAHTHDEGKEFEREDLLSKFMSHAHGAEDSYSDKELRDVTIDFLLAGRDTTAVTLAWFMYEICCNPEIADKIHKEGVEMVGKHSDFESMAEVLTHDNLGLMHYLHAALSESLRLHPPVPRSAKTAFADDILPDGTHVKKGEAVQYVAYSMGRMPFLWGSDALTMNPERWLRDGIFHHESPFKFPVFQAGPRICLGRDSAFLQLKVTVALLLHFFTFRLVPGQELTYGSAFVMPMKNGVQVTVSSRL